MTDSCPTSKHHLPGDCAKRELKDGYLKFPEDGCYEPIENVKAEVFDSVFTKRQPD